MTSLRTQACGPAFISSFRDLPVAEEAEILIDENKGPDGPQSRMQMNLQIDKERNTITKITARSINAYFFLKAVDQTTRTVSVAFGTTSLWTVDDLSLAKDTSVWIGTGRA